jgi:hypothetical protein
VTHRLLIFHPKVAEDLDAIVAHYAVLDPALPGRFRARLMEQDPVFTDERPSPRSVPVHGEQQVSPWFPEPVGHDQ